MTVKKEKIKEVQSQLNHIEIKYLKSILTAIFLLSKVVATAIPDYELNERKIKLHSPINN
jgi:hypothetical protein